MGQEAVGAPRIQELVVAMGVIFNPLQELPRQTKARGEFCWAEVEGYPILPMLHPPPRLLEPALPLLLTMAPCGSGPTIKTSRASLAPTSSRPWL